MKVEELAKNIQMHDPKVLESLEIDKIWSRGVQ